MVNVFNELSVPEASAQDHLNYWKQDTKGLYNDFKNFKGLHLFIHKFICLWSWIDEALKSF